MSAGLYVHVPFCSAICPYCDFAVVRGRAEKRRAYVETMVAEIDLTAGFPHAFDTIYFGGGTPSLLEPQELERLLAKLRETFRFETGTRLYLEANPEDADAASLAAWKELGVSTLSLGVQSFDAGELAFLGRRHGPDDARGAVEQAVASGFETVSVDLIYGLPGQQLDTWRRTLERAVELGPDHLSCYELEVHERTTFGKRRARGELTELPDDVQADFFVATHDALAAAGYPAYEVSNFARGTEHRSRHNVKYWHHVPYLGLGVSAHSFDGERRFWNERLLPRYEKRIRAGELARAGEETLTPQQQALEALMLGLRTAEGVDLESFERSYGVDLAATNHERIARWQGDGLIELEGSSLRPTVRGWAVADALASSLELSYRRASSHWPRRSKESGQPR